MTDQKTQRAECASRLSVITLRHRRFIYTCRVSPRVGIIQDGIELYKHLELALGHEWADKFESSDKAFEATFRYGSEFIGWIDIEWIKTETSIDQREPG